MGVEGWISEPNLRDLVWTYRLGVLKHTVTAKQPPQKRRKEFTYSKKK